MTTSERSAWGPSGAPAGAGAGASEATMTCHRNKNRNKNACGNEETPGFGRGPMLPGDLWRGLTKPSRP